MVAGRSGHAVMDQLEDLIHNGVTLRSDRRSTVMRFFLAWVCPPLAVLLCGKPFSAVLNLFLTLFFWMPGVMHANAVVANHLDNGRNKRLVKAINRPKWANDVAFAQRQPEYIQAPAYEEPRDPYEGSYTVGRNGTKFRSKR